MPSDAAMRAANAIADAELISFVHNVPNHRQRVAEIIDREMGGDRSALCVSFCRNIPTEFLEKHIVDWPFEQAAKRLFYVTTKPTMPDA